MGLVDETYTNKEKHFLYLQWKWNDREDTRRARKDGGRGCLDWDAEAGSFSPYLPPDVSMVVFGL